MNISDLLNTMTDFIQNIPNSDTVKGFARILVIIVFSLITISTLQKTIRLLRVRITQRFADHIAVQRAETIGRVLRYLTAVIVWLIATLLILSEFGINLAPLLGAAGIVGVAVGFGAQSLVKDYFSGAFLLIEDQFRQGDIVKLGEHSGLVEEMTLRYVRLRDYNGCVHFIPNGMITSVINMTRDYAQVVIDIGVSYSSDLTCAMEIMQAVTKEMREDPIFRDSILDNIEIAGVEKLDSSCVVLRGRIKVIPLEQWTIKRQFLQRLKLAFDQQGIEIPFPQLVLHQAP